MNETVESLLRRLEISERKLKEKEAEIQEKEAEIQEKNSKIQEIKIEFQKKEVRFQEITKDLYEELEQKEEELEQKEEEVVKYIKGNKYLYQLFTEGISKLRFMKTVTDSTKYKSDHLPIRKINEGTFKIIKNLDEYFNKDIIYTTTSSFLNYCLHNDNLIMYADEEALKTKVENYMDDIILSTNLPLKTSNGSIGINIEDDIVTKNGKEKKRLRPDMWTLRKNDWRAIIAGEIKSDIDGINSPEALGQIYNYMMKQKNFYNQRFVFGILTSLNEWRICWLNDSNNCAESDTIIKSLGGSRFDLPNLEREMYSSPIYHHTDKDLAKILLSVIVKCHESPNYPVEIFSTSRTYVRLTETEWRWTQYKDNFLNYLNANITLNVFKNQTVGFTVLKYFNSGRYSKVRLAISDEGNFVILKENNDESVIERENKCWGVINELYTYVEIVGGLKTLVMPLCFTITEDFKTNTLSIHLNLKIWTVEIGAVSEELPQKLEYINEQLKNFKDLPDLNTILEVAIINCSAAEYIHDDLELRHFALYPNFENGVLIELQPVLIDFEYVEENVDHVEAYNRMATKVSKILDKYHDYEFKYVK